MTSRHVFVAGSTGYMGSRLILLLLERRHEVRALVRPGSESKLVPGCSAVMGDALDKSSFVPQIAPADTFVQLVGVAHPSPAKAQQFRSIDLISAKASIEAAVQARIQHFVYVSVAHPAPMMKPYIEVRSEVEAQLRSSGLNATILRPWYVLGPGHRWPLVLVPVYWFLARLPKTRESALRLGLVTIRQMLTALVAAVEDAPAGQRILEVPQIREAKLKAQ